MFEIALKIEFENQGIKYDPKMINEMVAAIDSVVEFQSKLDKPPTECVLTFKDEPLDLRLVVRIMPHFVEGKMIGAALQVLQVDEEGFAELNAHFNQSSEVQDCTSEMMQNIKMKKFNFGSN